MMRIRSKRYDQVNEKGELTKSGSRSNQTEELMKETKEDLQVRADASRTVLRGKWEDCSPGCPGYDLSGQEIIHYKFI